jgi:O-antigen/teichoic acid export membrane protein
MAREMSAAPTSAEAAAEVRDLVRTLEVFYWAIGFLLGGAIILASPLLATHWLSTNHFSAHDLRNTIALIGLLILCRWPLSFYGGGITGLERQVLLSWVSFGFVCARSFGAVFVLLLISPTVIAFFWWQVAINLLNTAALIGLLWKCLPEGTAPRFRVQTLRKIRRFAAGITGVAVVSMLLTDLDKLVVSKMLPLEEFGYYSLAWRMASMLYMVSGPVFAALFPVFSRFVAAGDESRLAEAYHRGAQLMSVLILPPAITLVFFARPIIFAWTGSEVTAEHTWLLVSLLTGGTALNCVMSMPFALQLAYGWTSLAFWTNFASTLLSIPLLIILTKKFGSVGAASVWFAINASYLVSQAAVMHQRLLCQHRSAWYLRDLGTPLTACLFAAALAGRIMPRASTRPETAMAACVACLLITSASLLSAPLLSKQIQHVIISPRT